MRHTTTTTTRRRTRARLGAITIAAVVAATACGGDDDGPGDDAADASGAGASDDVGEELADAMGAGGGGLLTFDGEEHPIESATCVIDGDTVDVGTVGPDGFRVFVTGDGPGDYEPQVLDPELVQWFDHQEPGSTASVDIVVDGSTISAGPFEMFNNQDDRLVEASFTVECP